MSHTIIIISYAMSYEMNGGDSSLINIIMMETSTLFCGE